MRKPGVWALIRRLFCPHNDIIDSATWYVDQPPEFECRCKVCGKEFPPPDKWVETEERRRLHAIYFPHEPLIPAIGEYTDVE